MKSQYAIIGVIVCLAMVFLFFIKKTERTEINSHTIINSVEAIGKLELVKYNIQTVIEHNKVRSWLPDAKTLFVAVGESVVCIDFAKINEGDIAVKGDSIRIILPEPEICYSKIDHEKSKIYRVDYGLWETSLLVEEVYKYAEKRLQEEVQSRPYRNEAIASSRKILTPLFNSMGFTKVNITYRLQVPKIKD